VPVRIDCVFFDFDGVLTRDATGSTTTCRYVSARCGAKAGVQPRRSVFIDNDHENVAVAAGCGMHAIHFDHASNDVAALAARLRNDFGLPA
jgi:FMN phosphatase YigB (HAD superfamily)